MRLYTSPERVSRNGRLLAYRGEVMPRDEAVKRGLLDATDAPDAGPFDGMSVAALKAYAKENSVDLGGATKKDDILAILVAQDAEGDATDAPDAGDE